jgi:hypothetical protein
MDRGATVRQRRSCWRLGSPWLDRISAAWILGRMPWSTPFEDPIPLPKGRQFRHAPGYRGLHREAAEGRTGPTADVATCVGQWTTVACRVATIVASILEAAADSRESS